MDFATIKQSVRILDVLSHYSVHLKGGKNGWLNGDCPLPTHEKSKGTFAVNIKENFWMCHSDSCQAKRGKKGGDVISFVKVMDGCTDKEATEKLCKWFNLEQVKLPTKPETPARTVYTHDDSASKQEKAPARMEQGQKDEANTPSKEQLNNTSSSESVKPARYMQEVDAWFDELIRHGDQESDEDYWKRLRKGVKARLLLSFRNGKSVAQGLPAA